MWMFQTCPYMYDNFISFMDFNVFCISITNVTKINASQYDVSMLEFSKLKLFKLQFFQIWISIKLALVLSALFTCFNAFASIIIYVQQWEFSDWFFFQT